MLPASVSYVVTDSQFSRCEKENMWLVKFANFRSSA